jgi:glycosyltransferase involved in cell wall biosynthesis
MRLSAVIITWNEEQNLPNCLERLVGLADEIVVVDTGSTDCTVAIARGSGARVECVPWQGFSATREVAMAQAGGDWILAVDADEWVTPALAAEIRCVLNTDLQVAGFEIRRAVMFLGQELRHGRLGRDWPVRLVRRGHHRLVPRLVHERLEVTGPTARLEEALEHHTVTSLGRYAEKLEWYSALSAEELAERGVRYHWWDVLRLPFGFAWRALAERHILDGGLGLLWAAGSAYASWRKRDLLRRPRSTWPVRRVPGSAV